MRLLLLSATVLLAAGCGNPGPELMSVRGCVTYQGKPLTTGNVMFIPDHGPAASSAIDADGSYAFRAVAGTHGVAITAMPPPPPGIDPMTSSDEYVAPKSLIPTKYNRITTSGLTVRVSPTGDNVINFDLP